MTDKEIIINCNEKQRRYFYFEKNYKEILLKILNFNLNVNNFTQMCYNYVYEIIVTPKCICGNELKFKGFNKGYNKYCCKKCVMSNKEIVEKRNAKSIETNFKKYGVNNPMKLETIKNKVKNTNINKYGVDNYTKTNEYKEKTILNNNKKYNKNWYLSTDEFKEKSKKTNLIKYNVEHHTKSIEFKEKVELENLKKWGYKCYTQTNMFKDKLSSYYSSDKFTEDINKQKKKKILKSFEYYKNYNINYELISIKNNELLLNCKLCLNNFNINKQLFYLRNKNENDICTVCNPKFGKNTSKDEKELLDFIKENYKGEVITNTKHIINPLELDIYLPDIKLAFEFNGLYWHSELEKDKLYHLNKTKKCLENGIQLFHIWEDDWVYKQDIIKSMILNKLNKSNKIFARKCVIKEIDDNRLIREFLETNHIQGFVGSKVKLGLFFENELVSLMTFGNLRKSMNSKAKEGTYELLRFCNKLNTSIIGGASKLFKYFINNYNPIEVISYSDYSRSIGNMYINLGFNFSHLSNPNYYWCKNKFKEYRFNFRKDILVKEGFDPNKTEVEIMHDRGYYRLFDCGMQKWIYIFGPNLSNCQ